MNPVFWQQQQLAKLGLYTSPIDGISGPHTRSAIDDFQTRENVNNDWERALLEKIKAMPFDEYMTPEIELLLSANPNPAHWSPDVKETFRNHAKTYFLPTLKALCESMYIDMPEQIAYMMATAEHETFGTFLPVEEAFYVSASARKRYLAKMPYGERWCARGHVGLTWKYNYEKYSKILGINLIGEPYLALDPDFSLFIFAHGMKTGTYTGRKIEDYINEHKVDFINARRVVNGVKRLITPHGDS